MDLSVARFVLNDTYREAERLGVEVVGDSAGQRSSWRLRPALL